MTVQLGVFYLFAFCCIASAVMTICVRNPVHAVLSLISAFFSAAGLVLLIGAEFIAMILIIVYVGAVAVLFLFVVMTLDIDSLKLREGFLRQAPLGVALTVVLICELTLMAAARFYAVAAPPAPRRPDDATNAQRIGEVLYTDYIHLFQGAGLILLTAMIGAIALTLRQRRDVRRQHIGRQVSRQRREAVALKNVPPGQHLHPPLQRPGSE